MAGTSRSSRRSRDSMLLSVLTDFAHPLRGDQRMATIAVPLVADDRSSLPVVRAVDDEFVQVSNGFPKSHLGFREWPVVLQQGRDSRFKRERLVDEELSFAPRSRAVERAFVSWSGTQV